jgi:hypothetical protein
MYYEVGVSGTVPHRQDEGAGFSCGVAAEGIDGDRSMSLPRKVWPEQDKVQSSRCRPARLYQPMIGSKKGTVSYPERDGPGLS